MQGSAHQELGGSRLGALQTCLPSPHKALLRSGGCREWCCCCAWHCLPWLPCGTALWSSEQCRLNAVHVKCGRTGAVTALQGCSQQLPRWRNGDFPLECFVVPQHLALQRAGANPPDATINTTCHTGHGLWSPAL